MGAPSSLMSFERNCSGRPDVRAKTRGPDEVRLGGFSVFIAGRTSRWSSTTSMSRASTVATLQSKSRRSRELDRRDLKGIRCEIIRAPTEPLFNTQGKNVTSGANTIQVVDISRRLIPGTKKPGRHIGPVKHTVLYDINNLWECSLIMTIAVPRPNTPSPLAK